MSEKSEVLVRQGLMLCTGGVGTGPTPNSCLFHLPKQDNHLTLLSLGHFAMNHENVIATNLLSRTAFQLLKWAILNVSMVKTLWVRIPEKAGEIQIT